MSRSEHVLCSVVAVGPDAALGPCPRTDRSVSKARRASAKPDRGAQPPPLPAPGPIASHRSPRLGPPPSLESSEQPEDTTPLLRWRRGSLAVHSQGRVPPVTRLPSSPIPLLWPHGFFSFLQALPATGPLHVLPPQLGSPPTSSGLFPRAVSVYPAFPSSCLLYDVSFPLATSSQPLSRPGNGARGLITKCSYGGGPGTVPGPCSQLVQVGGPRDAAAPSTPDAAIGDGERAFLASTCVGDTVLVGPHVRRTVSTSEIPLCFEWGKNICVMRPGENRHTSIKNRGVYP